MPSWLSLRSTLAALLVGSAALFAIGVAIERSQPQHSAAREATERAAQAAATAPGVAATAGGETPAERAGEGGTATTAPPAAPVAEVHSERVFGLNPDATGLVVAAITASLLLALGVWRFPALRPLLVLVVLAALAFCAFDVREAAHQANESRTGLVVVAALVAALHLAAAVVAVAMARRNTPVTGRPRTEIA